MMHREQELINIIDEVAGAAVSMNQGAQNYDSFIKAREKCMEKIHAHFIYSNSMRTAIKKLIDLV
jgi:hypothetical protein